jgi:methionyl-tRNA formyltransferase
MTPTVVFFGSFQTYSQLILDQLLASSLVKVVAVVTTPPTPMGKAKVLTKNPVHILAETAELPTFTPSTLDDAALHSILNSHDHIDYFVTAGYGKLLPAEWLSAPKFASLNLHFSLLPKYRGANPAEWAILLGETETGVTLIEMSPEFDTGTMVAQAASTIEASDTRETVYQKLYELGGQVLPTMLATYHSFRTGEPSDSSSTNPDVASLISYTLPPIAQPESPTPYAKRLHREDGFVAWETVMTVMRGETVSPEVLSESLQTMCQNLDQPVTASFLERATRALRGFPGLWTLIPTAKGEKRMKILASSLEAGNRLILDQVQIEGQGPAHWNQVKNSLL